MKFKPACALCGNHEAIWAFQYIADDRPSFYKLGHHIRGFGLVKVCEICRCEILARFAEPDYSSDDGSGNRQPDDITPDPEGECVDDAVTVAPASTSPYTPRMLWHFKMSMMIRFGRYAAQTVRAFALSDAIYPQYA